LPEEGAAAMGGLRFMSAQAVGILVLVVVMLVTGSVNTLSKVPIHHYLKSI
jgi:heme exporter protein D